MSATALVQGRRVHVVEQDAIRATRKGFFNFL